MNEEIIIEASNISKSFKLPHDKNNSIKSAVVNFYKRQKSYEIQKVLNNVSFEVVKGEFFGIVGRNGSGKSTLLKMLAGIYLPTNGNIKLGGSLTPFIELGVGFNQELTGRENVYLNGALLGFSRNEMNALYPEIVEFAELERFMDQKLKNYSSGMQVRLAFSIAIRARSDILLIDEVLAVGDAAFQKKCFDYFMQMKKEKRTLVLVTHDMGAVNQYCDRAMMIEKGKIVKIGDPEEISQAYRKLFNDEISPDSTKNPDSNDVDRWGTGKLVAKNSKINLSEDYLTLTSFFTATVDLPAPILGFTILGPSGNNILEGNTLRKKYKTRQLKKGEAVEIIWKIPNIFSAGKYDISVACCNESATEFYDWLNKAASFTITREGSTAGVVDPPLEIIKYTDIKNDGK